MSESQPELQPELICEILSRLPAKSILQFRSVSKLWRTLIDNPHFTKTHINHSLQSLTNQTLILTDLHSDRIYSVSFETLENAVELDYPVKHISDAGETSGSQRTVLLRRSHVSERQRELSSLHRRDRHPPNQIWGCCHGLILLTHCVWNPTTRKHTLIPDMKTKAKRIAITLGLGYDSGSDDYKVVKIVKNSVPSIGNMNVMKFAFWVYSLKRNSWREIADFPSGIQWGSEPELRKLPPSSYMYMDPGVFVSGALHWLVKGKFGVDGENDYIMAFDLGKENYRMMLQPKCQDTHSFSNLGVVNGHLCVICSYCPIGFDIWMMEEYGVAGSWTRMTLRNEAFISYPGGLTKAYARDGEKVLLIQSTNGLRWYGLKRKIMEDVVIENKPHAHDTNVCLSSLVALDEDD